METQERVLLDEIRRAAGRPTGREGSRQPSAAILTCVDERVVPEAILGCKPGRLYCVRLAGHVVTPEVVSSLEIALGLGCRLVFVLGHTDCGAVRLERERASDHFPIVQPIRWATRSIPFGAGLDEAIEANVREVVTVLRPRLRARVEGGVYDLAGGRLRVLE